jgi:hypothetical protein
MLSTLPKTIEGSLKGKISPGIYEGLVQDAKEVRITYFEDNYLITILETNIQVGFIPTDDHTYLDIKGVSVLENTIASRFTYHWYQNGISIQVEVEGYGSDESRRIVKSMIE